MERGTRGRIAQHIRWQWKRKRKLSAVATCLGDNGWTIEELSRKQVVATRFHEGLNYDLTFRPPQKPGVGWTGHQRPSRDQASPLPERFREFVE